MFHIDSEQLKSDLEFYWNELLLDSYFDQYFKICPQALEDISLFDKACDDLYARLYGEDINFE